MSRSLTRAAERLQLCLDACGGLITRLNNLREVCNSDNPPRPLQDKRTKRLYEHFLKILPDYPIIDKTDKTQVQYEAELADRHVSFCEDLEPFYLTLLDVLDLKNQSIDVINDLATLGQETAITLQNTPDIFRNLLNLLVGLCQMCFLLSLIDKAKTIACGYAYSYRFANNVDSNFHALAVFLKKNGRPIRTLQKNLLTASPFISSLLLSLDRPYRKMTSFDSLKREGVLSVLHDPLELQYPVRAQIYYELPLLHEMTAWLQWGYLLCPRQLTVLAAQDLCRLSLCEGIAATVFRRELCEIHDLYYAVWTDYNDYRKLHEVPKNDVKKHKAAFLKPAVTQALEMAGNMHAQRRQYLHHELKTLLALGEDCPGLLGPKAQLVFCLLSLARDEVMWYFRHASLGAPKGRAFKRQAMQGLTDRVSVSRLVSATDAVLALMRTHTQVVVDYHRLYLSGNDRNVMSDVLPSVQHQIADPKLVELLQECQRIASGVDVAQFVPLRINWQRAQLALASQWKADFAPLTSIFNRVVRHSLNVDDVEGQLRRYASFQDAYWFTDIVQRLFSEAIDQAAGSCGALVRICQDFVFCVHSYLPEEQPKIGRDAVELAKRMLLEGGKQAAELVTTLHEEHLYRYDRQTSNFHAYRLYNSKRFDNTGGAGGGAGGAGGSGGGGQGANSVGGGSLSPSTPGVGGGGVGVGAAGTAQTAGAGPRGRGMSILAQELPPGAESHPANRAAIQPLLDTQSTLKQLCYGFSQLGSLVIYDTELVPIEFVKDSLVGVFRRFIPAITSKGDRPSSVLSTIESEIGALCAVQNFADLDACEVVEMTLLSEFTYSAAGPIGGKFVDVLPKVSTSSSSSSTPNGPSINNICEKYLTIFSDRGPSIVYSPIFRSFLLAKTVSSGGSGSGSSTNNIEEQSDPRELQALTRMIGPSGLRALDQRLLQMVKEKIGSLKEAVTASYKQLKDLQAGYQSDEKISAALKSLSSTSTNILGILTSMGSLQQFRFLLHDAQGEVLARTASAASSLLFEFSQSAAAGEIRDRESMPADLLAYDVGAILPSADPGFHGVISSFVTDPKAGEWLDLLPYAFGCLFASSAWKDADYSPSYNAHTNNGHCIVSAVIALTIATKSPITSPFSAEEKERQVKASLTETVRVASAVVLRQLRASRDRDRAVRNTLILLEKLVIAGTKLCPTLWDACLPYSLIEGAYVDLFAGRKARAAAAAAAQQSSAADDDADGGHA